MGNSDKKIEILQNKIKTAWAECLFIELKKNGFQDRPVSTEEIIKEYFNFMFRILKPIPRAIYKAKNFVCPTELNEGLKLLESKVLKGESLKAHQSRDISGKSLKLKDGHVKKDNILTHWNIHHFHLGTTLNDKNQIIGGKYILFAYIDGNNFFELKIGTHDFYDIDLITIIHKNWPKLIEHFKLNKSINPAEETTKEDIKSLMNANVNFPYVMKDGTRYGFIGCGTMANGSSSASTFNRIRCNDVIKNISTMIIMKMPNIDEKEVSFRVADRKLLMLLNNNKYECTLPNEFFDIVELF